MKFIGYYKLVGPLYNQFSDINVPKDGDIVKIYKNKYKTWTHEIRSLDNKHLDFIGQEHVDNYFIKQPFPSKLGNI